MTVGTLQSTDTMRFLIIIITNVNLMSDMGKGKYQNR